MVFALEAEIQTIEMSAPIPAPVKIPESDETKKDIAKAATNAKNIENRAINQTG